MASCASASRRASLLLAAAPSGMSALVALNDEGRAVAVGGRLVMLGRLLRGAEVLLQR